jgi:4-hydroxy-2-oxoheptanedioate aldolase
LFENPVKQKLAAGGVAFGAVVLVPHPLVMQYAVNSGADFIWIETEHTPFGTESIDYLPVIARRKGITPLIRISNTDAGLVKKALDVGASALMIPQVENAEQARRIVDYAKYPPKGSRGVSPMWTFYMDVPWKDYLPVANDETLIVVQIESAAAMEQLEEIAAVDGVDVLLAGPMDLSASLGVVTQIAHPDVDRLLVEFPERVKKAGKVPGIAVAGYDAAAKALARGYRFINFGNVLNDGAKGIAADLERLRALTPGV